MLWIKFHRGVLRVLAGSEVRLVEVSGMDQLRLLWLFRNFHSLPFQVLSQRQRALVERLSAGSVAVFPSSRLSAERVIGTIERPAGSPAWHAQPPKKPSARQKVAAVPVLPRASGMGDDWAPQPGAPTGRWQPGKKLSGAAAPLRALAETISTASHRTGKLVTFPARTHACASSLESSLARVGRGVAALLRGRAHVLARVALQQRLAFALLIAIASVLAFALTRNSAPAVVTEASSAARTSGASRNSSASRIPGSTAEASGIDSDVMPSKPAPLPSSELRTDEDLPAAQSERKERSAPPPDGPRATSNDHGIVKSSNAPPAVEEKAVSPMPEADISEVALAAPEPAVPPVISPPAVSVLEEASTRARLQQGPRRGIVFPSYPAGAWKSGKRGRVTLRAQVTPEGAISGVDVLTGDPALAQAAGSALRRWHYNQQPGPAEVIVHFNFINPEAISVEFER